MQIGFRGDHLLCATLLLGIVPPSAALGEPFVVAEDIER
jgi:hypothetical protein